jgi:Tfp pilus assembly protein PilN
MIRINLLGQARPKATKQAVPLEATMQVLFACVAVGLALAVLFVVYISQKKQLDDTNARIASLRAEKASLQQIKQQVDSFESEKSVLQQRINVIETLQKNRSGAQDLLQMVANTTVRVETVWLTTLNRTGDSVDLEGQAGSIDAVANLITELKRSGYFDKIEIKDAKENSVAPGVDTYGFSMSVGIAQTQPTSTQPPQGGAKGRS